MSLSVLLRRPSAFLPLLMSGAAIAVLVTALALMGFHPPRPQQDEGAAAHLWQLLMAGQLPIIGFFALVWLPRQPRDAWKVVALQVLAIVAAAAPVFLLGL